MSKVVLVGSSIFAHWDRASHAFVGHHVKNCAIGGTTSEHWLELLIGVLDNEAADAMCFYCGSNDFQC
ncbi:MAG: hypothetical protein VX294_13465 [Candidatus Latescibacterota bacterium]|nr:hypothetical protein [Candidatus Latescibacterota bacterium]